MRWSARRSTSGAGGGARNAGRRRHPAGADGSAGRTPRTARPRPAPRRPGLCGVRAGRDVLALAALAAWVLLGYGLAAGLTAAVAVSSSPAPAPSVWRRRPRSWSAPAGVPSSASSSAARRSSSRRGPSTRCSSIRPGTVTTGLMAVVDVVPGEGETAEEVLRLAGALESGSEHPIARRWRRPEALRRWGSLAAVEDFGSDQGLGVHGVVDGRVVVVGRPAPLQDAPPVGRNHMVRVWKPCSVC